MSYIKELRNGKQIRIKNKCFYHDYVEEDSGWMEELWIYDNNLDLFKCFYPISTYEENFFTTHDEESTINLIKESYKDNAKIYIEQHNFNLDKNKSIKEQAIELINKMSDEEIKRRIFL